MTEIIKQISAAEFSADNLTHSIDATTLAQSQAIVDLSLIHISEPTRPY